MDWPESTDPKLYVFPRGLERDGGMLGSERVVTDKPLRWTSQYGSIVTAAYDLAAVDGFNEKGLGGHLLYLVATDYGQRDPAKPALQSGAWLQYLLDNAANVQEALDLAPKFDIVLASAHGYKVTVHLALEDAGGDSAIVEFIGGRRKVYHGREHTIMTNDPPYSEQLKLLKSYDFTRATRDTPLGGNVNATDRFQRAAFYAAHLPEPQNPREAVASMLSVIRNVSVPFGAPYRTQLSVYNTEYRTIVDSARQRYFWESTSSPNVFWVDLDKFKLAPGSSIMRLDPTDGKLNGAVWASFRKLDKAPF